MNNPNNVPPRALGSTGDIEQSNRVMSINGMKIVTSTAAPVTADNTKGDWHPGDLWSTPASGAAGHLYQYGTDKAWHQLI